MDLISKVLLLFITSLLIGIESQNSEDLTICPQGCQQCQYNDDLQTMTCLQCMDSFQYTLVDNKCYHTICEESQFQEVDMISNIPKCVSLCSENTIGISNSLNCSLINTCSKKFIQATFISKGRSIQDIQLTEDSQYLLVIYSNFLNAIDPSNGIFMKSYVFDSTITFVKNVNGLVYLFSSSNQIFVLDNQLNNQKLITQAKEGIINNKSDVIKVINNSERLFVASYIDKDQVAIFTEISEKQQNLIQFTYEYSIFIFRDIIVLQNEIRQVKLILLVEDISSPQKAINLVSQSSNYLCSSIQDTVNQIEIDSSFTRFFLTFFNTPGIKILQKDNNTCNDFPKKEVPIKIAQIRNMVKQKLPYSNLIFASFSNKEFLVFDGETLEINFSTFLENQILDFIGVQQSQNSYKIFTLQSSNIIKVYQIIFDQVNGNQFQLIDSQRVIIDNPVKLILVKQLDQSNLFTQICVVSEDIQLINFENQKIDGITIDYQEKSYLNKAPINALFYAEEVNLALSCSEDGKLVVWNLINILQSKYYYNIERVGQECINVLVFKVNTVVSLFTKEIIIFDIFNQFIFDSIPIDPLVYSKIQVSDDFIYLFHDNKITIFRNLNDIVIQKDLVQNQFSVFVSKTFDIYIVDTSFQFFMFSFDVASNTIQSKVSINNHQSQKKINFIDYFDLDTGGVYVIYTNEERILTILNQVYSVLYTAIKLKGDLLQVYQYNSKQFFMRLYSTIVNKSFPYIFQYLEINNGATITNVHQSLFGIKLIIVKKLDIMPGHEHFLIHFIVPISHSTLVTDVYWDKTIIKPTIQKFNWNPGQNVLQVIPNKNLNTLIEGAESGAIALCPRNKNKTVSKVFTLSTYSSTDQIQFLRYNFFLGIYLVITTQNIYYFDFFKNDLIDIIKVEDSTSSYYILDIIISQDLSIFIGYSQSSIVLKDLISQKILSLNFNSESKILSYIKGCYLDNQNQKVFIYGQYLLQYDINLSNYFKISQAKQQIDYEYCYFLEEVAICKYNINYIIFYDRNNNFNVIQTIQVTSLTQFKLQPDIKQKLIYLYSNNIEVYSFQGVPKATFMDLNGLVFEVIIARDYIVAFTHECKYFLNIYSLIQFISQTIFTLFININLIDAYTILREDLKPFKTFNSTGEYITKVFYFPEINVISYITEDTKLGQVKVFSLEIFQSLGTISSNYYLNKIGNVKNIYFDPDQSMICYLDQFGNIINNIFEQKIYTDNMVAVPEMQREETAEPIDYILDFNTNEILVYNNQSVWRLNYNVLIKVFYLFNDLERRNFIIFKDSQQTSSIQLLYFDQKNAIYIYQESKVKYLTNFDDDIYEMRKFTQKQMDFNILVFKEYIIVYEGDIINQPNLTQYYFINEIRTRKIILIENDYVIIQTNDNLIIDYDFTEMKIQFQFQLEKKCTIATTLTIFESISIQYILFSLSTGSIIKYDLINKQFYQYDTFLNAGIIVKFIKLSPQKFVLSMRSGDIYEVDGQQFQQLPVQAINQIQKSFQTPFDEPKSQQINFFEIDIERDRYFLSISEEKKLGVFRISDNSLIKILSFPEENWKYLDIIKNYVILSNKFQLNVYNQDLNFISYYRRSNRLNVITKITFILDNYLFLVQQQGIETIYIDEQKKKISLIDSISLQNPKIAYYSLIDNNKTILILGLSQTGVFEERLSLGFLQMKIDQIQNQTDKSNYVLQCTSQIQYDDSIKAQNEFNDVYQSQIGVQQKFFFTILINNEIEQMSFLEKDKVQLIIRPKDQYNNRLNIRELSFFNIKSNVFLDNFSFYFIDQQKLIKFQQSTKQIIIQNTKINDQVLLKGTSIQILDKDNVHIDNLTIENISLKQEKRALNAMQSETSSLFDFQNISNILLSEIKITNLIQMESTFILLNAFNVENLIIRSLTIIDSHISNLFIFSNVQKLRIISLNITNCQGNQFDPQNNNLFYIMTFNGIQNSQIHYLLARDNQELLFIQSYKQYIQDNIQYLLQNDTLIMESSEFIGNKFKLSYSNNYQINLITLQNSNIKLNYINYKDNYGNILIENINYLKIAKSTFISNNGVSGAALQLVKISISAYIIYSNFENNQATSSGGALSSTDVNQLFIDDSSLFKNNFALIGGAIRCSVTSEDLLPTIQSGLRVNAKFELNKVEIYGQNVATYPSGIILSINQTSLDNTQQSNQILFQGKMSYLNSIDNILIQNLISGGLAQFSLHLLDDSDKIINFNLDKFLQQKYPVQITQELNSYEFEVEAPISQSDIEIKGESILTIKQYDQSINSFSFKHLTLQAAPDKQIQNTQLKLKIYQWDQKFSLNLLLKFRKCVRGEILVLISSKIMACRSCSVGTYSLNDFQNDDISSQTCKKCPNEALSCQDSKIVLKQGYWRENNLTDLIIQCNQFKPEICDNEKKESKLGCIEGYIGPLCETCDYKGIVWNNIYSPGFVDYSCQKCSNDSYQIMYFISFFLAVLIYLLWSIIMFMNNYIYNARCTYIRFMNMIPLSKSCISDESTFIIKSLLNYLQMSQVLYQVEMNFIPQLFTVLPSIIGQPMGRIVVSSSCFYMKLEEILKLDQEIMVRTVIYIIIPFFYLLLLFILLLTFQKFKKFSINKYHKYMMVTIIFFFFQPDSISYFTSSLTCKSIGDKKYQRNSLIVDCEDGNYTKFKYSTTLPFLIFWAIFPLILLIKYIIDTNKSKNLQYCTNKFKYGYFYLEYKQKYYYWEFIRIYFRISIVLIMTLAVNLDEKANILCIILIALYISSIHIFSPFQIYLLKRLEILSNFIMIINSFLSLLDKKYSNNGLKAISYLIHNGIIALFIIIAIKMKLQDKRQFIVRIITYLFRKLLPTCIFQRIFKEKTVNKLLILFYWKKVRINLHNLASRRIEEQLKKMKSDQKNVSQQRKQSIILDEAKKNNRKFELVSENHSLTKLTQLKNSQLQNNFSQTSIFNMKYRQNETNIQNEENNFNETYYEECLPQQIYNHKEVNNTKSFQLILN